MTACFAVLEPAAIRAAGHKYKLRREVVKDVLRTVLRAEVEQEFHFFIADLDHVGVVKPP